MILSVAILGLFILVPAEVSAKQTNTKDTYYLYNSGFEEYKGQKTLAVMQPLNSEQEKAFNLQLPAMTGIKKIIFSNYADGVINSLASKCPNVTEVQVRKNAKVSNLSSTFSTSKHLKTITVDSGNKTLKSNKGVLYTKDMKKILLYPKAKRDASYTMPSTVINIGKDAFTKNTYLTKVTLGKKFRFTQSYEKDIISTPNLKQIVVASGNKKYKASKGVLFTYDMKQLYCYPNGKKDKTYTVPSTVTTLLNSFGKNPYLKTLVIGKRVSSFCESAENGRISLPNLTNIKVASGNKHYKNYNGTLFTADYKTLVYCARGKTKPYKVKAGTKILSENAFANCKIAEITLPKGLKTIECDCFPNTKIESISLPASITELECFADGMHNLSSITLEEGCKNFYMSENILYASNGEITAWPEKTRLKDFTITNANQVRLDLKNYPNLRYVECLHIAKDVTSLIYTSSLVNLKKIELDSKNTSFQLYNGVLYNADYSKICLYPNQNEDTSITLHENLKELKERWFSGFNNTVELTLPAGISNIDTFYTSAAENKYAEPGKESEYTYTTYESGLSQDEIQWGPSVAFSRSPFQNLKKINLSEDNAYFTCKDNVLYNKDMTELVWYPVNRENEEYTLPDTVTKLDAQLREMTNLKKLTLNSNVKSTLDFIGTYSDSLESIIVPDDHPSYSSANGILYDKNKNTMIVYPNGKTDFKYVMPGTVTAARFYWRNSHLTELTLSPALKTVKFYPDIEPEDFYKQYVGTGIFGDFNKLEKINGLRKNINFTFDYIPEVYYDLGEEV